MRHRSHIAYILLIILTYSLLIVAFLTQHSTRDPLVAQRGRALVICLFELGFVSIIVPWSLSKDTEQGRSRNHWKNAVWRTAVLLVASTAGALIASEGSVGWALRKTITAQGVAASFALLIAGLWCLLFGISRRTVVAQIGSSVLGGLMISTLFWSPVVLELMRTGLAKRIAIDLLVYFNPTMTVAGSIFKWDITTMPIAYRIALIGPSYQFRYFSALSVAVTYAILGGGMILICRTFNMKRNA